MSCTYLLTNETHLQLHRLSQRSLLSQMEITFAEKLQITRCFCAIGQ